MVVLQVPLPAAYLIWFAVGPHMASASEVISDLGSLVIPSPAEEHRALEIKADKFWQAVLTSAEDIKMNEHLELYDQAEKVIADLAPENEYVRKGLSEAVQRLRSADETVLMRAVSSSDLASNRLTSSGEAGFSFFSGGQNFLKQALQRFVAGARYSERLLDHIMQRQADILPLLYGVAGSTGSVLGDTKTASRRCFDVLKYDIYNKGVPKTPQAAKDMAYKLVDAASETRHRFMQFVTQAVNTVAQDYQGRSDGASATVAQSATLGTSFQIGAPEQLISL